MSPIGPIRWDAEPVPLPNKTLACPHCLTPRSQFSMFLRRA